MDPMRQKQINDDCDFTQFECEACFKEWLPRYWNNLTEDAKDIIRFAWTMSYAYSTHHPELADAAIDVYKKALTKGLPEN